MREIDTNLPVPDDEMEPLTPVVERRQWLEKAFQKKPDKERAPTPTKELIHDRLLWIEEEKRKSSDFYSPNNKDAKNIPHDLVEGRKEWLEEEVLQHRKRQQMAKPSRQSTESADSTLTVDTRNDRDTRIDRENKELGEKLSGDARAKAESTSPTLQSPSEEKATCSFSGCLRRSEHVVLVKNHDAIMTHKLDVASGDYETDPLCCSTPSCTRSMTSYSQTPSSANSLPGYAQESARAMAKAKIASVVSDENLEEALPNPVQGHHRHHHRHKKSRTHHHRRSGKTDQNLKVTKKKRAAKDGKDGQVISVDQQQATDVQCLGFCTIL